ncbi:Uncharacterized protein APZ42_030217 [Daphnia magna]|uniref:Uncharacterized protein n=1 Tax=Daphnia magna TaxID=35525 RepID=A0A164NYW4_9CRUS|nr:Uncharacterized protein APZ42_030217 [Daphnia magna]
MAVLVKTMFRVLPWSKNPGLLTVSACPLGQGKPAYDLRRNFSPLRSARQADVFKIQESSKESPQLQISLREESFNTV